VSGKSTLRGVGLVEVHTFGLPDDRNRRQCDSGQVVNRNDSQTFKEGLLMSAVVFPMRLKLFVFSAFLTVSLLPPLGAGSWNALNASAAGPGEQSAEMRRSTTVLVELFTSEGCSTCPPADMLLTALDQTQPIEGVQVIVLSEHVDYWNQQGWKDPFSSAEFTGRQAEYARAFGDKDAVYTPQMVVDGRTQLVGSHSQMALRAIANAARLAKLDVTVAIARSGSKSITLAVQVRNGSGVSDGDTAEVMLALTESSLLSTVARGENSGRKLAHSAVVRKLTKLGTVDGGSFNAEQTIELNSSWKRQNMKAVVFIQERRSRRVIGAGTIRVQDNEPYKLGDAKL
jgi:hypothetical protein